jgi:hypothetical protein
VPGKNFHSNENFIVLAVKSIRRQYQNRETEKFRSQFRIIRIQRFKVVALAKFIHAPGLVQFDLIADFLVLLTSYYVYCIVRSLQG